MYITAFSSSDTVSGCMSVRLSVCPQGAYTGNMSVKFGVGNFYKNLSKNIKCDYNRAKISGAIHIEFVRFIIVAGNIKPL
jgi:hypothetical protein